MIPTRTSRIAGAIYGHLIGDALSVPYEFKEPTQIPQLPGHGFEPPPGFFRTYPDVPPGTWSDDGATMLCLLESLVEQGALDLDDLGDRLLRWRELGHLTPDGIVFDIGNATSDALRRLSDGTPAAQAGSRDESANGNGALMRVLPLALIHAGSDAELFLDAASQSLVTHGHFRSQLCCSLYCLWVRNELKGTLPAWDEAVRVARSLVATDAGALRELEGEILSFSEPRGDSTGTPSGPPRAGDRRGTPRAAGCANRR